MVLSYINQSGAWTQKLQFYGEVRNLAEKHSFPLESGRWWRILGHARTLCKYFSPVMPKLKVQAGWNVMRGAGACELSALRLFQSLWCRLCGGYSPWKPLESWLQVSLLSKIKIVKNQATNHQPLPPLHHFSTNCSCFPRRTSVWIPESEGQKAFCSLPEPCCVSAELKQWHVRGERHLRWKRVRWPTMASTSPCSL